MQCLVWSAYLLRFFARIEFLRAAMISKKNAKRAGVIWFMLYLNRESHRKDCSQICEFAPSIDWTWLGLQWSWQYLWLFLWFRKWYRSTTINRPCCSQNAFVSCVKFWRSSANLRKWPCKVATLNASEVLCANCTNSVINHFYVHLHPSS